MMKSLLEKFNLQLFAEGDTDTGSTGGDDPDAGGDNKDGGDNKGTPTGGEKTFTQTDIDDIITKRLSRERKAWEKQLEEEKKKATMTETERLKAEKEEAEQKANERQTLAETRIIKAEAKGIAAELGIKPERLSYAIRLADLSGVEVNDEGEADSEEVKKRIKQVLDDLPELKSGVGNVGSGSNPAGGDNSPPGGSSSDMNEAIRSMWRG